MLAYHSDKAIKEKYLDRVRAHQKADEIIKGKYWEDGKGCAVGCTVHSGNHNAYETELGIPIELAYLEDELFENLPNGYARKWPLQFLSAIKPGADLSLVFRHFLVWLLVDKKEGVIKYVKGDENTRSAIQNVANLHIKVILGQTVTPDQWAAARDAARAAGADAWAAAVACPELNWDARAAAWDAAKAAGAAARAAGAAARAAAWDARAAARAAGADARAAGADARAAAWDARADARAAAIIKQSEKLLELLANQVVRRGG